MSDDLVERTKRYFVSEMLAVLDACGADVERTTLHDAIRLTEEHWDVLRGATTPRESIPRPAAEPEPCPDCGAPGEWVWIDDAYGMKKLGTRHHEVVVSAAHWQAQILQHRPACPAMRPQKEAELQFSADELYAQSPA